MANVANAYQALLGAGETVASGKKKKTQKQKQKQEDAPSAVPTTNAPAAAAPKAVATQQSVLDIQEATAIFERSAREARSISDKCKLWKEWARQVSDRSGKTIKYKTIDGLMLDFKQAFVRSKALEISIESALVSGLGHEHHESLSQVLSAFLSGSNSQSLTSQLIRLSALLTDEAPDTLGAAQRAVHSVIAALKTSVEGEVVGATSNPVTAWLLRFGDMDKEIGKQQALQVKLSASSGGVVTKEQLNCAKTIFKLSEEKFDLLQPNNIPSAKSGTGSGVSSKAIDDLKAVISSHLREASALEDSVKSNANSAEAKRAQTLAAYRREESIISQESQEVAAQIRSLEAQLRALKSRQSELGEKQVRLQSSSRRVNETKGSSRAEGGVLSASHYKDEMAVVQALKDLMNSDGHASPEQVKELMQGSQANAPIEYLSHGYQFLTLALASLNELPGKLNFCKQRLSHADKLMKLVAGGSHAKQKEDVEKLLAEHIKVADDLKRSSMQMVSEMNQRYDVIAKVNPDKLSAAAEQLKAVDLVSSQIQVAYEAVHAAHKAPLIEAAIPAPVSRKASGKDAAAASAVVAPSGVPRPISAPVSKQPATVVPVPVLGPAVISKAPADKPTPAPAATTRQWGRLQAATPSDSDSNLPTPAEAAAKATITDGFKEVSVKKNRKQAA